jgi:hypothetical protein
MDCLFFLFTLVQVIIGFIVAVGTNAPSSFKMIYPHTFDRLSNLWDVSPVNYVQLATDDRNVCELDEEEVFFYTRGKKQCSTSDRRMLKSSGGRSSGRSSSSGGGGGSTSCKAVKRWRKKSFDQRVCAKKLDGIETYGELLEAREEYFNRGNICSPGFNLCGEGNFGFCVRNGTADCPIQ